MSHFSETSRDTNGSFKNSNNDNHDIKTSQLPTTQANMMVDYLANSNKLITENRRWMPDTNNLDDDIEKYVTKDKPTNQNNQNIFVGKNNSATFSQNKAPYTETYTATKQGGEDLGDDDDLSGEELMLKKLDMLRKLSELAQAGVKLSQNYNMNSDLKIMKYEYELHKNLRAKQNGINWLSNITLNMIYGIEMLNENYDPFSIKLKGWSEAMNADINNYYDVFGELYEKYNQPGKNMAPELKLLLMVSGSALKFHLSNTIMGKTSTLNEQMDGDPQLLEEYRKRAMAERLKQQTTKNNSVLNEMMEKEHDIAIQKALDLQKIKEQELEYERMQKEILEKNNELNELKNKLSGNNSQTIHPSVQRMMAQQNNIPRQPEISQQQMLQQQMLQQQMIQQQKLLEQQQSMARLQEAKLHQEYLNELKKMEQYKKLDEKLSEKYTKSMESKNSKLSSRTSKSSKTPTKQSNLSNQSKTKNVSINEDMINVINDNLSLSSSSNISLNKNLNKILSETKKDYENSATKLSLNNDKIVKLDIVSEKDVPSQDLSNETSKNSKESKLSKISRKSKLGKGLSINL
jgi:hypothetical protein